MNKHEITMAEVKRLEENGVSTFSRKDNSVRGIETILASQVEIGDKIVIDNYFHTVIA